MSDHCASSGLYLTDITFCREGNPSHRNSPKNPDKKLLNFNKYHKLARIVQGQSLDIRYLRADELMAHCRYATLPDAISLEADT